VTSNTAPLLQAIPFQINARTQTDLGTVYRKWAEHYNSCETCQRDEWFNPLMGEPYFCEEGRRLFRAWVNTAQVTPPTQREGKRNGRG